MSKKWLEFIYTHPEDKGWVVFLYRNPAGFFSFRGVKNAYRFEKSERMFTRQEIQDNYDKIMGRLDDIDTSERGNREWFPLIMKMRADFQEFEPQEW
jgi:hypothetical protein